LFELNQKKEIVWECIINLKAKEPLGIYQASRYSFQYVKPLFKILKKHKNEETRRLRSLPYIR